LYYQFITSENNDGEDVGSKTVQRKMGRKD
jgi:hypothetical protein